MNKTLIFCIGAALLAHSFPANAANADRKAERAKKRAEQRETRQTLGLYDSNRDGQIDGEEREAFRKAYEAFKALDKNNDGMLDDSEIDSLKIPKDAKGANPDRVKKGKAGKKKRMKKEGAAATS